MRRLAMRGLGLAAMWLSAMPGLASWEPPPRPRPPVAGAVPPQQQAGAFQRMLGTPAKPKTPDAQGKTTYDPTPRSASGGARPASGGARTATAPAVEPAGGFDRDQRTYLRRLAVCDKLREIARDTNDDDLLRKADQIEQRAWSACMRSAGQAPIEVDDPVDDRILEKHLGPTAGQTPGLSNKADRLYSVPGTRAGHARAREDDR